MVPCRRIAPAAISVLLLAGGCSRSPERPNIAIIVLDAVRRDYVGAGIPGRSGDPITPNVDLLASQGITFTNAWANGPWTLPSHVSLFTGLLPSSHGCTGASFEFRSDEPTFAELLRGEGYETAAFYSNPWLTDELSGMLRGFDQQYVDPSFDLSILSASSQGGTETLGHIEEWLEQRDKGRPFLMFVNLLEAHLPYDPPAGYRERYLSDLPANDLVSVKWAHEVNARVRAPDSVDWDRVRRLYAGDVNTADSLLGELLGLLEKRGYSDDTIVVVTSDHGENLGDHGFTDHQFGVFETLLGVPLVLRPPDERTRDALTRGTSQSGSSVPVSRDDPVMLTDLYPTVLELAGLSDVPSRTHARSLLDGPAPFDRFLIAEYVVPDLLRDHLHSLNPSLDEPWLYSAYATVRSGDIRLTVGSDGSVELEDYSEDPLERSHLEERGRALANALDDVLPVPGTPSERKEIDPEMREALRALGYLH